jgi:hypothetical protein
MSKELNETLVMTTCKCRENNSNLVMTRQYFEDVLANKTKFAVEKERIRIFKLITDIIEGDKDV